MVDNFPKWICSYFLKFKKLSAFYIYYTREQKVSSLVKYNCSQFKTIAFERNVSYLYLNGVKNHQVYYKEVIQIVVIRVAL